MKDGRIKGEEFDIWACGICPKNVDCEAIEDFLEEILRMSVAAKEDILKGIKLSASMCMYALNVYRTEN